jgi:uncharacterized protein (DUF924 family)
MKKAREILDFWFGSRGSAEFGKSRKIWFEKSEEFDSALRDRFGAWHRLAAAGRFDAWQARPQSALALIVLLDQFSRNMFRGTPAAFACDERALSIAMKAVARRFDRDLPPVQRWFIYLPYEHAESLGAQRESLRLFAGLRGDADSAGAEDYARRHFEIIARFGRFPHRNAILGRASTAEELEFLKKPGSGF